MNTKKDANLRRWIEEFCHENNEPFENIEAIVIGEMGWGDFNAENVPQYADQPKGKILTWLEAAPLLDYDFNSGFGAPECNAITVWTKSYILFVATYDGSTRFHGIPRNPIDYMPEMPGG